ncbi:S8 family serine peptidase [Thalassotalea euphylliae]|uniref:S8 family serine peptidase n=1 Tax=Thalassotalea euphylliae TaxID=1655234 RepID=UPI00362D87E7
MKTKVAIAISAILATVPALSQAGVTVGKSSNALEYIKPATEKKTQSAGVSNTVFTPERDLDSGTYRYFVRLSDSPVALYEGGLAGMPATNPVIAKSAGAKLSVNDKNVKTYRKYLTERQTDVLAKAKSVVGKLNVKQQTTLAFNGFVVEMTQADAIKLATVPGIANIHREKMRYTTTDVGPQFIQADKVWEGASTGVATKGEGVVVGIIDTGINTDNPSFADVGGDGYDHTNPWGEGVYSGDCATEEWADLCNDKLIGVHSWDTLTDLYADYDPEMAQNGQDYNGHGSHVAGTTAGNVLSDVDAESQGVTFDRISGVAPHANIVSYQVCLPGEDDAIGFNGCFPSLTVLAVEHAIEAGVDVLNYSVGGGSTDPWNDADALAFLAAREAGIHVATSAGNSGPEAGTVGSPGDAPWISTVAAATHNRDIVKYVSLGGENYEYASGTGPSFDAIIEGPLTNAAVVDAANFEGCEEFSAGAFDGAIALISRGTCTFETKVVNATAAGAQAVIIHNNRDGDATITMSGLEGTTVPSIMVSENNGAAMAAALEGDASLTVSIDPAASVVEVAGGEIADFSSRGANTSVPDVLVPSIAAPGVSIFAPYADEQSAGFKENPDPSDYAFLSGTSMASPHMAGALALIADLQPTWSPAAVQSALMLTANQSVLSHDGTDATFFDMGAGMADVNLAAQTGLVVDEDFNGYMSGNPSTGGQPSQMNLASMANASCVDTCTWTRTVTATKDGDWTATIESVSGDATYTVSPESFSLSAGQTQELTVTADVTDASEGWQFANLTMTAEGSPDARMPIVVKAGGDNLPESINIDAGRDTGSVLLSGFKSNEMTNITAAVYDKVSPIIDPVELNVPDDGLDFFDVTFDEALPNVIFSTTASPAPDVDLRILDAEFNNIGSSAGATQFESVAFTNLAAGTYYVVVDGYTGSSPGATDPVTVEITAVQFDEASLSETVSVDVIENGEEFDLNVSWEGLEQSTGYIALSSDEGLTRQLQYSVVRGEDDVQTNVTGDVQAEDVLTPGVAQSLSFDIAPNFENADKVYTLTASASSHEFTNIANGGEVSADGVTWTVERKAGESSDTMTVAFDFIPRKSGVNYTLTLANGLNGDTQELNYQFSVPEVAPTAVVSAASRYEKGDLVQLDASGSFDANGDDISFAWTQRSGKPVTFDGSSPVPSFLAPSGGKDGEVMTFDLVVTDANGNTDEAAVSFTITSKSSSGGSMGYWLLALLPLLGLRRRSN